MVYFLVNNSVICFIFSVVSMCRCIICSRMKVVESFLMVSMVFFL